MIGWKPQFNNPKVASVRYRCLYPLAELRRREFPAELFTVENLSKYSAVVFSKSYDDESYEMAVEIKRKGIRVIFDICDNHFYNPYGLDRYQIARVRLLKMLSIADLVVTSTPALAQVIRDEARLSFVPVIVADPIEEQDVVIKKSWLQKIGSSFRRESFPDSSKTNILWYGAHGVENAPCGMLDLLNIRDILSDLCRDHPFRLIVVSNSAKKFRKYIKPLPFETIYFEWGHVPFRGVLTHVDLNVIPLTKNPFTLCKSNNRLALALYEGVPTVADEIPSYTEFSPFCILNDWESGMRLYLGNKAAGQEHVKSARAYIQDKYTIGQIGDQWIAQLSRFLD